MREKEIEGRRECAMCQVATLLGDHKQTTGKLTILLC